MADTDITTESQMTDPATQTGNATPGTGVTSDSAKAAMDAKIAADEAQAKADAEGKSKAQKAADDAKAKADDAAAVAAEDERTKAITTPMTVAEAGVIAPVDGNTPVTAHEAQKRANDPANPPPMPGVDYDDDDNKVALYRDTADGTVYGSCPTEVVGDYQRAGWARLL